MRKRRFKNSKSMRSKKTRPPAVVKGSKRMQTKNSNKVSTKPPPPKKKKGKKAKKGKKGKNCSIQ